MPHRFVLRKGDQILAFDRYEDIPDDFDHVIEFRPEIPDPPHTPQQHDEIEAWQPRFQRLMEKERARSSKTR